MLEIHLVEYHEREHPEGSLPSGRTVEGGRGGRMDRVGHVSHGRKRRCRHGDHSAGPHRRHPRHCRRRGRKHIVTRYLLLSQTNRISRHVENDSAKYELYLIAWGGIIGRSGSHR